jgi:aminoglycoside phosphotransferase (APT) family kinase protein
VDPSDVTLFLLRRRRLEPGGVVDDGLVVRHAPGRHRNLVLESGESGAALFVKQAREASDVARLEREGRVCAALAGADEAIARCVPRVVESDPAAGILVLELVRGSEDLRAHDARTSGVAAGVGERAGRALAALHRTSVDHAEPAEDPWALAGHRPSPDALAELTPAGAEAIRIAQRAELAPRLDEVRASWRASALIHNDLSCANVLVGAGDDGAAVTLVDWELAGWGDPDWDVGSFLAACLSLWLLSTPSVARLASLQPAMAGFWRAYLDGAQGSPETEGARLPRVTRFAAARLVQTAFESAQTGDRLSSGAVLHLQVAANVLTRPDEAVSTLLGFGP